MHSTVSRQSTTLLEDRFNFEAKGSALSTDFESCLHTRQQGEMMLWLPYKCTQSLAMPKPRLARDDFVLLTRTAVPIEHCAFPR